MKPSQECFELIKKWEGLHKKRSDGLVGAYRDPVNIWTIGYGSIYHLDLNRPIRESDVITKATAERWLELEVEEKAEDVERLSQVTLKQCMFDAVVSFTYNIGIGAFGESTLLRKLNAGDYDGAAREFDRWVHGEDNGARRVLPGLVNRRNDEEALFRRDGFPILVSGTLTQPGSTGISSTQPLKEELPYQPAPLPLPFTRTLIKGDIGSDCYVLNCALAGLGFLRMAAQPNEFNDITENIVKLFQTREALSRVDGKVGPETKRALENSLQRARPELEREVYCRLTRTGTPAYQGLEWCKLDFVDPASQSVVNTLKVISGLGSAQKFLLWNDSESIPGNLAPIPQDRYAIADISWAGGKDNYTIIHAKPGIGPVWVALTKPQGRPRNCSHSGCRDEFGFHGDWQWIQNRTSPGSAGCICPSTKEDLEELVQLLRKYDPRLLVVDWGL